MRLDDIVGYTYRADNYGPECITRKMRLDESVYGTNVEDALDTLAEETGIDRQDESSFDSWDFPKVIFRDQLQAEEHCGSCGCEL